MPASGDSWLRVSAVIPALNEAGRIKAVLDVILASKLFSEVFVVDDGSTDGTANAARDAGATVICHEQNCGKAIAMLTGVNAAAGEIITFLDADLLNVTTEHLTALVQPVVDGDTRATLGVFRGGRAGTALGQRIAPTMSGQRCLERELLDGFTGWDSGFGIETEINAHLRLCGVDLRVVEWHGAAQVMKEEKRGVLRGFWARLKMYWEMFASWFRLNLLRRKH